MPEGVNKGSSYFFLDTFTPTYAKDYFRPDAYHTWGTDKVINGAIVPKAIEEGGSWRITDPDTESGTASTSHAPGVVAIGFHFVDLGARPTTTSRLLAERRSGTMSSTTRIGDPPIWQYDADPLWQQTERHMRRRPAELHYTGGTPCRMMPRLGRDVAYGLFFRSTAGYLYRPIPQWRRVLAGRLQLDRLLLAAAVGQGGQLRPNRTVVRHLVDRPGASSTRSTRSAATRGRRAALAVLGDAVRPLGRPHRRDDPALRPDHATSRPARRSTRRRSTRTCRRRSTTSRQVGRLETSTWCLSRWRRTSTCTSRYGDKTVDLTERLERRSRRRRRTACRPGLRRLGQPPTSCRDYIDAHRRRHRGHAFQASTRCPSMNMVFEKAYTWALPADRRRHRGRRRRRRGLGRDEQRQRPLQVVAAQLPALQPGDTQAGGSGLAAAVHADPGERRRLLLHDRARGRAQPRPVPPARRLVRRRQVSRAAPERRRVGMLLERPGLDDGHLGGADDLRDVLPPVRGRGPGQPAARSRRGVPAAAQDALRASSSASPRRGPPLPPRTTDPIRASARSGRCRPLLFKAGDYLHGEYAAQPAGTGGCRPMRGRMPGSTRSSGTSRSPRPGRYLWVGTDAATETSSGSSAIGAGRTQR